MKNVLPNHIANSVFDAVVYFFKGKHKLEKTRKKEQEEFGQK